MSPESELDLNGARSGAFLFTMTFQEGIVVCAMLWPPVLAVTGFFVSIEFDILHWFFLTLLVGSVLWLTVYGLKWMRFRNPVANEYLLTLFEEVKADLGKGQRIELWFRNTDKGIFLSTTNLLFKAILFSESTIADILGKREKGKIVLAREVLMMERVNPIRGFALGLLVFTGASYGSLIFFVDFASLTVELRAAITIFMFIGLLLALIVVPTVAAWSTRHVDETLKDTYGSSPAR